MIFNQGVIDINKLLIVFRQPTILKLLKILHSSIQSKNIVGLKVIKKNLYIHK